MPTVVISEFMDAAGVDLLSCGFDVLYDPALVNQVDALAVAIRDARALIVRNRTQVRGKLLDAAGALRIVGRLGVGLDNIDVEACRVRGIAVYPATGANDDSVAEYVVCTAMMLLRRAYLASAQVAGGQWPRGALVGREIGGKRLGLVGYGSIARKVAQCLSALGMSIAAHDPYLPPDNPAWRGAERLDLNALLSQSDVVSLHVPLTPETHGLIDRAALSRMRPDAVLVNAARGGVVDEPAVAEALRAGKLGGAALDVFAEEPLTAERGAVFAGLPNVILTPHIAGVTVESNSRVSSLIAEKVLRALEATA